MNEPVPLQLDTETQKLVNNFNVVMADAVRTREMKDRAQAALWTLNEGENDDRV